MGIHYRINQTFAIKYVPGRGNMQEETDLTDLACTQLVGSFHLRFNSENAEPAKVEIGILDVLDDYRKTDTDQNAWRSHK